MTSFDRDIQGREWRPCGRCPHATPAACPSRAHAAFCWHVADDPATWSAKVAALPAETRPPRELPPGVPAPPAPTRGPGDAAASAAPAPRPELATRLRRLARADRLARGCPYHAACGCTKIRCHRDGRDAVRYVTREDCRACAERLTDRALPAPDSQPATRASHVAP